VRKYQLSPKLLERWRGEWRAVAAFVGPHSNIADEHRRRVPPGPRGVLNSFDGCARGRCADSSSPVEVRDGDYTSGWN
jgi:hypothetical protein